MDADAIADSAARFAFSLKGIPKRTAAKTVANSGAALSAEGTR